jgi:hypothetical protein
VISAEPFRTRTGTRKTPIEYEYEYHCIEYEYDRNPKAHFQNVCFGLRLSRSSQPASKRATCLTGKEGGAGDVEQGTWSKGRGARDVEQGGPALAFFSQVPYGVPDRLEACNSCQDDDRLQDGFPHKLHGLLDGRRGGQAGPYHVVLVVQVC